MPSSNEGRPSAESSRGGAEPPQAKEQETRDPPESNPEKEGGMVRHQIGRVWGPSGLKISAKKVKDASSLKPSSERAAARRVNIVTMCAHPNSRASVEKGNESLENFEPLTSGNLESRRVIAVVVVGIVRRVSPGRSH